MKKLNPFRVSPDRSLGDSERRRARIGATVVSAAALVLGLAGVSAQLNAGSDDVAAATNATPEPEVRMLARKGENPAGKSCEDQTWPYIEQRCLKPADAKAAERTTPKHGLGTQAVVLSSAPQPAVTQSQSAIPETTGAASPREAAAPAATPLNPSLPPAAQPAGSVPQAVNPAIGTVTAVTPPEAMPPLSKREARRLERQERKRLQRERREQAIRLHRERREQAKRVREERAKARGEAREAKRQSAGDRIVRRWSEYTYESPNGRHQRVIVIRRGSLDDDFFRTVR